MLIQILGFIALIGIILALITIPFILYVRPGFGDFWKGVWKGYKGEHL